MSKPPLPTSGSPVEVSVFLLIENEALQKNIDLITLEQARSELVMELLSDFSFISLRTLYLHKKKPNKPHLSVAFAKRTQSLVRLHMLSWHRGDDEYKQDILLCCSSITGLSVFVKQRNKGIHFLKVQLSLSTSNAEVWCK